MSTAPKPGSAASLPLDIPLRRYRQDATHPGVPTTGAPARWSGSSLSERRPDDSDDDEPEGEAGAAEPLRRKLDLEAPLVDLTQEDVFVLEAVRLDEARPGFEHDSTH